MHLATQYASAPASLTIIGCKYENRQRLQFTTEFAKTNNNNIKISTVLFYQVCADNVKAMQTTAEYGRIKQVDIWPSDLESGIRVTCDVGYLGANFSLPKPLCSRLRPDVRDRQTSDRLTDVSQHHRLMPHNNKMKLHDNLKNADTGY